MTKPALCVHVRVPKLGCSPHDWLHLGCPEAILPKGPLDLIRRTPLQSNMEVRIMLTPDSYSFLADFDLGVSPFSGHFWREQHSWSFNPGTSLTFAGTLPSTKSVTNPSPWFVLRTAKSMVSCPKGRPMVATYRSRSSWEGCSHVYPKCFG